MTVYDPDKPKPGEDMEDKLPMPKRTKVRLPHDEWVGDYAVTLEEMRRQGAI